MSENQEKDLEHKNVCLIGVDQQGNPVYEELTRSYLEEPLSEEEMTRKEFIATCAMGTSVLASFGLAGGFVVKYLYPDIGNMAVKYVKQLVASTDEIASGKAKTFKDPRGKQVYLVNDNGKYIALSGTCTHLGCIVGWQEDKHHFYCPCHGGTFNPDGEVIAGPPPAPLERYKVDVEGNNIYVHVIEA